MQNAINSLLSRFSDWQTVRFTGREELDQILLEFQYKRGNADGRRPWIGIKIPRNRLKPHELEAHESTAEREAERYSVRYAKQSWFSYRDGRMLTSIGRDNEWDAIKEIPHGPRRYVERMFTGGH